MMLLVAAPGTHAQNKTPTPDSIDYSMFFDADVRDTPECQTKVVDGVVTFGPTVTNPAVTCPDAFAWKVFSEIAAQNWWEDWATDRQTFPSDPWPRCKPGESAKCCPALVNSNDVWPEHCPVFPGPTAGVPAHATAEPSKAHQMPLAAAAAEDLNNDGKKDWDDVPDILRGAVIGAVQGELIYRNEPMLNYIYSRGLYSVDGLADVYANFVRAAAAYAPRHAEPDNPLTQHADTPPIVALNFPIKSIMVKVNWLPVDAAPKFGIDPYNEANPYIIMDIVPFSEANAAPKDKAPTGTRPHILLSMHISTKDLPNWFWSTFEHVDNIGRCDWIGCNDSFGYLATGTPDVDTALASGLAAPARNYVSPHRVDKVDGASLTAFDIAEQYPAGDEKISDGLAAIFAALKVGTGTGINRSGRPTQADAAWRSYRLKGTQTNFVTPRGRPTRLGNSVTEAGFVNSASCITCHARAGATKEGLPLMDIFTDTLSDAGIQQSVNGMPNEAWFQLNAFYGLENRRSAPKFHSIQTDFVWGFRLACPIKPLPAGPSWCANVEPAK